MNTIRFFLVLALLILVFSGKQPVSGEHPVLAQAPTTTAQRTLQGTNTVSSTPNPRDAFSTPPLPALIALQPDTGSGTAAVTAEEGAPATEPQKVKIGFFLLSGGKLDFVSSSIALDFYLWLNYTGSGTPTFEFLNSKNYLIEKQTEEIPYPGTSINYVVYRVKGTFDQQFDLKNYPFDRFVVRIFFEDTEKVFEDRIYVQDTRESGMDPMFHILGWEVKEFFITSRRHIYDTNFGTPLKEGKESYSQVECSLQISRNHGIIFVKMVTPAILFLMIAVLGVVLPIDQLSQKISLCVASLFSSVAYHLSLSQGLPPIGYLTFVDKMMIGNYCAIFLNLLFTITMFLAHKFEYPRIEYVLTRSSWFVIPLLALSLISNLIVQGFYS